MVEPGYVDIVKSDFASEALARDFSNVDQDNEKRPRMSFKIAMWVLELVP